MRLTEYSHVLASPIPARYEDSYVPLSPGEGDQPSMLANVTVTTGFSPVPRGNRDVTSPDLLEDGKSIRHARSA